MKFSKIIFLSLFLTFGLYSCEPEEMPQVQQKEVKINVPKDFKSDTGNEYQEPEVREEGEV